MLIIVYKYSFYPFYDPPVSMILIDGLLYAPHWFWLHLFPMISRSLDEFDPRLTSWGHWNDWNDGNWSRGIIPLNGLGLHFPTFPYDIRYLYMNWDRFSSNSPILYISMFLQWDLGFSMVFHKWGYPIQWLVDNGTCFSNAMNMPWSLQIRMGMPISGNLHVIFCRFFFFENGSKALENPGAGPSWCCCGIEVWWAAPAMSLGPTPGPPGPGQPVEILREGNRRWRDVTKTEPGRPWGFF